MKSPPMCRVFVTAQRLCERIRQHVSGRYTLDGDDSFFHYVADESLSQHYIFSALMELWVIC